jgi:hypothetical protein
LLSSAKAKDSNWSTDDGNTSPTPARFAQTLGDYFPVFHCAIYRLVGLDENGKRKRTRLIVIKLNKERSAVIGFAEGGASEEKEARAIADKAR